MWDCVNSCMRRLLPGFSGWVIAVIVAAIIAALIGTAGIGIIIATAGIAIGAAGVTMSLYCFFSCRN